MGLLFFLSAEISYISFLSLVILAHFFTLWYFAYNENAYI